MSNTTTPAKPPMAPMLKFVLTSGIVLSVLFLVAFALLQAVGSTGDAKYIRKGTIENKPTVNIRGQLD